MIKSKTKIIGNVFLFIVIICSLFAVNSLAANEDKVYLSDLSEKILSKNVYEDKLGLDVCSIDELSTLVLGNHIEGNEIEYDKGLSFHCIPETDANAYVEFDISGMDYNWFEAYVGVQSYTDGNVFLDWGCINFIVKVDGNTVAESGDRAHLDAPYHLVADISGGSVLRLEMNNAGGHACDAGVFAQANLSKNVNKPTEAPTPIPTATPSATQPPELNGRDPLYISDMVWVSNFGYVDNSEGLEELAFRDTDHMFCDVYMNGEYYEKCVGMHATGRLGKYEAHVEVDLSGLEGYTHFISYVGVPEDVSFDNSMASVVFIVYVDDVESYRSKVMRAGDLPELCKVDITGAKKLRLVLSPDVDGISGDCGIWGKAALSKKSDEQDIFATPEPTATPEVTQPPVTATPDVQKATTAPTNTPDDIQQSEDGSKLWIIFVVLGAAVIIGAVILVVSKKKK